MIVLYKAMEVSSHHLTKFIPSKNMHKPAGYYFAPSLEVAKRWGELIYGINGKQYKLVKCLISQSNIEVIGAVDGYYSDKGRGWIEQCGYFSGRLYDVKKRLASGIKRIGEYDLFTKKFLGIREVEALPEIIIKENMFNQIKVEIIDL